MPGPEPEVDVPALAAVVGEQLGTEITDREVLADGLNLVVALGTTEGTYVLRRPNKLRETYYMNDVRGEYDLLVALQDTPVPAPSPVLFVGDGAAPGAPAIVTTYLEGETVPLGSALPERYRTPDARRAVCERLVDTLADIHAVDTEAVEHACPRRVPAEVIPLAADRFEASEAVTGHEPLALTSVREWLTENAPSSPETTLVHGDFRPGNVLFAGPDSPEIVGVLDWETANVGDPLVDLGYLLLRWRDDGDPTPSLDPLAERHPDATDALADIAARNEAGLAPFTSAAGSPDRGTLVDRYERSTGRRFENRRFYRAYAAFLLATVWADLHRERIEAGTDSGFAPWIDYSLLLAKGVIDDAP